MKKTLYIFGLFFVLTPAYAAEFKEATSAAASVFQSLRQVAYVLAGFGLAAFAVSAIFGKISFKWLGLICCGLFILAYAGSIAQYITGKNASGIEEQAPTVLPGDDPASTSDGGTSTSGSSNTESGASEAADLAQAKQAAEQNYNAAAKDYADAQNANNQANSNYTAAQNAQTEAQADLAAAQAAYDADFAAAQAAYKEAAPTEYEMKFGVPAEKTQQMSEASAKMSELDKNLKDAKANLESATEARNDAYSAKLEASKNLSGAVIKQNEAASALAQFE